MKLSVSRTPAMLLHLQLGRGYRHPKNSASLLPFFNQTERLFRLTERAMEQGPVNNRNPRAIKGGQASGHGAGAPRQRDAAGTHLPSPPAAIYRWGMCDGHLKRSMVTRLPEGDLPALRRQGASLATCARKRWPSTDEAWA